MNRENQRRVDALCVELKTLLDDPHVTTKTLRTRTREIEAEVAQLEADDVRSKDYRRQFAVGPGELDATTLRTKQVGKPRWAPASPVDASTEQIESMWIAAKSGIPYQFELGETAAPSRSTWPAKSTRKPSPTTPASNKPPKARQEPCCHRLCCPNTH